MSFSKLHPGSKVCIVAPAGKILPKDLEFAKAWLESNQWECIYSDEIYQQYNFGYFYAGTDLHRKNQLQKYLDDDSIDAIWFARGGYGSVRLIDDLNFDKLKQKPKWLIGYSDITVFHNHLNNIGIPTIHGVTAKQLNTEYTENSYASLKSILVGEKQIWKLPPNDKNICGQTTGKLVGGNLSIIYSLLGSKSFINGENLILFIEDWYENWYHLDRMLMAIKRQGLLMNVNGIMVGSFTKMDVEEENPEFHLNYDTTSKSIIHSFVRDLGIPVVYDVPAGHIGDNQSMIFGIDVSLKVEEKGAIIEWNEF